MAKLLYTRIESYGVCDNPQSLALRQTSLAMKNLYQHHQFDFPKDDITSLLCMAAVIHLGSRRAVKLLEPEPRVNSLQDDECDLHRDKSENILTSAAYLGNLGLVELLLCQGAEVNGRSEIFGTALQAAVTTGSYEIVLLLLERGANVNFVGGNNEFYCCNEGIAL